LQGANAGHEYSYAKATVNQTRILLMADSTSDRAPEEDLNKSASENAAGAGEHHLEQHHVSKILDEVLEEPEETPAMKRFRHPMWLDLILGAGLLITVGGFSIGLFKIYVTHTAEQCITQRNYPAAIAILRGTPVPNLFAMPGADTQELLNQALYLDAMDKLELQNDVQGAIRELGQIEPGSRFFKLAQEIITEDFEPSSTQLKAGAEVTETNPKAPKERKSVVPEIPQDASP
jgi:hypothetical protein